jgi:hypothetical protein
MLQGEEPQLLGAGITIQSMYHLIFSQYATGSFVIE